MRKFYLLSLLLPLWSISSAAVQVQTLSTDYANRRVTFALSWAAGTRDATHLSKVWVLVDYQEVTNPNTTGAWQRATVVSATATTGTVSGNTGRGFFVQGTDGAFSSTVTVTLSGVPAKFNWCATATDYPPVAYFTTPTSVLFKGTSPFYITYNDASTATIAGTTATPADGKTMTAITDATGCPGVVATIATSPVTGANTADYSEVYILNGSNSNVSAGERGFVYSSSNATPTIATGTKLAVSAGVGTMSYNWPNSVYSTTFYVRAYAVCNGVTLYGNVVNFKTWGQWYGAIRWNTGVCYGSYGMTTFDNWAAWPCRTTIPASTSNSQWQYLQPGGGSVCTATSGSWYWSTPFSCYAIRCAQQDGVTRDWVLYRNRTR